jgi:hypothetical protein
MLPTSNIGFIAIDSMADLSLRHCQELIEQSCHRWVSFRQPALAAARGISNLNTKIYGASFAKLRSLLRSAPTQTWYMPCSWPWVNQSHVCLHHNRSQKGLKDSHSRY